MGQLRIIQGGHLKIRSGDWEKFKYDGHTKFLGGLKNRGARLSGGLLQRGVIFILYIPDVVQLGFSLHLTPMHMSLFSDRLIIFQAYQFKEIGHFGNTE